MAPTSTVPVWQPPEFGRDDAGKLRCESVDLAGLVGRFGTPLYVYSLGHIDRRLQELRAAFGSRPPRICYAVKANDALGLLAALRERGTGFDIVSGGELERVLAVGADPASVVFSGVGKRDDELAAALAAGIRAIHVESRAEAERLGALAEARGQVAPVAVRVNPDVDPQTHPAIATGMRDAKFGVAIDEADSLMRRIAEHPHLNPVGVACHIGSQLLEVRPLHDALDRVLQRVDAWREAGIELEYLDLGGGLGIPYHDEQAPDVAAYARGILERLGDRPLQLLLEPGRFLVGGAGLLLTRVLYPKPQGSRLLAIVDAAMTELMRPALYDAWHGIAPVAADTRPLRQVDVVGPVCESTDVLARNRELPDPQAGDLWALFGAGAYGSTMAHTYNTRPRPAEILVHGDRIALLRPRESVAELLARDRHPAGWVSPHEGEAT